MTPLVNGQAYAYADIVVTVLGSPIAGISSISYSDAQEVTENYGAGRFPVSRGLGKIESEASMTIDRAELNALIIAAPLVYLTIPIYITTIPQLNQTRPI